VKVEQSRRARVSRSHLEQPGRRVFQTGAREFALRCRADRIDALRAGGASIIDYKTGAPPSVKQVKLLWAPQLPLEGVILREAGFENIGALEPAELLYIKFSGGAQPGDEIDISDDIGALVEKAEGKRGVYPARAAVPRRYFRRLRSPGACARMVAVGLGARRR
jgi:ATP-dependent helicase/nuclease subunit B